MTIATHTGATETEITGGVFDAADAFLARIKEKGAEKLPEENEEEEHHEEQETEAPEADEESTDESPEDESEDNEAEETEEEASDDDEKPSKAKNEDDDVVVKIKVGDEEHEVPVKDLKRLYGQEAALTRKSQEVAAQRKQYEELGAKQTVALQTMLNRAMERAKPYEQIDFLTLAKDPNITGEELSALRSEAQKAFDDVRFYSQELDTVYQTAQQQRQQTLRQQAIEAHKVLNDPEKGIKGWSQALYDEIRYFAIGNGIDANFVNEITDPAAIKLIHKAMLFDKGQKALEKTTKVIKTPKKILKSGSTETSNKAKPDKSAAAKEALARTGSGDAATELFFSRIIG